MHNENGYKISVIGAGSWGTTIAKHLAEKGFEITLWVKEQNVRESILRVRENHIYLPKIKLPDNIYATNLLWEALTGRDIIIFSVPSQYVRAVLEDGVRFIRDDSLIINTAKGIELTTFKLMHEVFKEVLSAHVSERYASLSGPSFAQEVARHKPTAVAMGSKNLNTAEISQRVFSNEYFRVYLTDDIVGVETGGSLKNVIAIAAGIAEGIGLGHNSKSALITRGLAEITRLGVKMSANPMTFLGLSGVGDLVLTCTGELSRNREVGMRIGKGEKLEDILSNMKMVAEGVKTSLAAKELAHRFNVDMPIAEQVSLVLYEGKSPETAIFELMTRQLKHEIG
ncbi:MAG TPA: NAD(P)H-dependent glycerol-3-phosphate dehydrogenase [Thermodesulfobacteriota bacterium]|jgi:glycerol-3-phosphate dehydrogenase (NAD(P)+)